MFIRKITKHTRLLRSIELSSFWWFKGINFFKNLLQNSKIDPLVSFLKLWPICFLKLHTILLLLLIKVP
jgi:hypothetical protein